MWTTSNAMAAYVDTVWDGDDCKMAFRPKHEECDRVLPTPFVDQRDCERAVSMLNANVPCNGLAFDDVVAVINKKYGSVQTLCHKLVAECCRW